MASIISDWPLLLYSIPMVCNKNVCVYTPVKKKKKKLQILSLLKVRDGKKHANKLVLK